MMTSYDLDIVCREPCPDDKSYLYNSWITSLRYNKPFDVLERHWYNAAAAALIARILASSNMLVAVNPSNSSQIFGYIVYNNDRRVLHYIYIKKSFRKAKVATRLMDEAFNGFIKPINYTVRTSAIPHYEDKWNLQYRPYLLAESKGE